MYLKSTALLSGTLRTYQRAGCDDEFVTLKCPTGTRISIEVAQYGKSATTKPLCNHKNSQPLSKLYNSNTSCLWSNSLQVSIKLFIIFITIDFIFIVDNLILFMFN